MKKNKKKLLKRIFIFPLIIIISSCSLIFLPDYLNVSTVLAQYSEYKGPPPQFAIIDRICRGNSGKLCNETDFSKKVRLIISGDPRIPGKKGDIITDAEDKRLGIDGTPNKDIGVILGFQTKSKQKIKNFIAASGFSKFYSEYFYPCRAQGSFTIGWESQKGNNGCSKIQYSPDESRIPRVKPENKSSNKTQSKNQEFSPSSQTLNNSITIDQGKIARSAAIHARQYCSVIENGGGRWDIQLSELTYASSDPKKDSNYQSQTKDPAYQREATVNVCNRALELCQSSGDKKTCSIVNHGKWISTSQRPINLTLNCQGNQRFSRRGNGREVSKLLREIEQEAKGAKSCTFNIYNDGDILISPSSEERTLIHTNTTDDGFVINDLVGKVKITKLGNPAKPSPVITLKPRQRYEYSFPKPRNLNKNQRKEVYKEPVIQEFLQCDRWDKWGDDKWKQEICTELNQYRQALNKQFYTSPAVQVTEPTIDGIPIWLSTIDLSNSETIITLISTSEVKKVGGFASFVKKSNAALIASGTFREDRNWTMKSQGRFISGQDARNWSNYTVLGLKSDSQPEMKKRPTVSEEDWKQYWFAITGHPRLVNKGTAGITEVTKGFNLNISRPRGRAAIGFSIKDKKLYHVIPKINVSLPKLAKIMQSIGCDEAVNLEGGNGKLLAEKHDIKVSGQMRSPLIVVYDPAHPAPESIRREWENFK
ncbi:MAG: phosphodiester glycosidase family protein [Cyanobacteria bacterium P01_A01_bin.45]